MKFNFSCKDNGSEDIAGEFFLLPEKIKLHQKSKWYETFGFQYFKF